MYSAYYINPEGILCYDGKPTNGPNLKEHFKLKHRWGIYNGKYSYNLCPTYIEHEVWGVSYDKGNNYLGLLHGHLDKDPKFLEKHGLYCILLNYTYRKLPL